MNQEQDLSSNLRQVADSAPTVVQAMANLSSALDRMTVFLQNRRLRRTAGVPVPVEDGGNRDGDTWDMGHVVSSSGDSSVSPQDRDNRGHRSSVAVSRPPLSQGHREGFWDGTRWRFALPGQSVPRNIAQGHP